MIKYGRNVTRQQRAYWEKLDEIYRRHLCRVAKADATHSAALVGSIARHERERLAAQKAYKEKSK